MSQNGPFIYGNTHVLGVKNVKHTLIYFPLIENYFGPWFEHVHEFWNIRHEKNLLYLFYDDMMKVHMFFFFFFFL